MLKILMLLSLLVISGATAQNVKFYGVVQDSTENKLSSASVVAAQLSTQAYRGFSITDDGGVFEISLPANDAYSIKVSYMGYHAIIDTIYTKENDVFKKYVLKTDQQQLNGVEIKYEMPVSIKGDTIIYNADSFTNGNEKKLGDVLKKMPGIEVEKDGTVKVEGKTVKKVMVEGKNFFEGDSKLASKNIPANAVKKVEVLRDYNENSQLKNFEDNEDSYAINIRLKEGKKNFWFGDITTGAGTDEHYLLHPKLFYYSPKKTYNFIGDVNNTGNAPMSFMDYFKMTGGFDRFLLRGGSSIIDATQTLGFSLQQNDKALAMKTQFGAFNYNYTLGNKLNLDGFFILNHQKTDMLTEIDKEYTTNNLMEYSRNLSSQNNYSSIAKTSLDYNPNNDLSIKYDLLIKYTDVNQNNLFNSNIRAGNETIESTKTYTIDQGLEFYKTLKNNNLMTLSLKYNYAENQPVMEALSKEEFFATSNLINLSPQGTYDLMQNKQLNHKNFSSLFDYYLILNKVSHMNFTFGTQLVWQDFNSEISQIYDNGQAHLLNQQNLRNNAHYHVTDLFSGIYYKLLIGKMIIRPGASLHYYYLKDIQFDDVKTDNIWSLLPELKIKYQLKNGSRIRLSYQMTNNFTDIQKYAQGYVMNNYNSLFGGNRGLESVLKHQISLRYSKYSMRKFYHLSTGITYNRSINSIRNKTKLIETDIISTPVNLDNNDENLTGHVIFGKRYIYWKFSLNANINWAKYFSILNGEELSSTSLSQNYKAVINTNLSGFINFDLSYGINLNQFDNQLRNSLYITERPSIGIELRMFQKTTQLNIKYDYYNYRDEDKTIQNQYAFLSTDLFYQKTGSAWEFVLSASNLLNNKSIDKESLTDLYIATSKYYVMPKYIIFKATYKL